MRFINKQWRITNLRSWPKCNKTLHATYDYVYKMSYFISLRIKTSDFLWQNYDNVSTDNARTQRAGGMHGAGLWGRATAHHGCHHSTRVLDWLSLWKLMVFFVSFFFLMRTTMKSQRQSETSVKSVWRNCAFQSKCGGWHWMTQLSTVVDMCWSKTLSASVQRKY